MEFTDANGEGRFRHIAKLATTMLSLPFSNASVERAFSVVNVIKDKLRNKMAIITADAIMRVRSLNENCTKFEPSKKMLKNFTNENVYKSDFTDEIMDAFQKVA